MKITETGKYKLTQAWSSQGSNSIAHYPAGTVIEITQVDKAYRKVIGPKLEDWEYYDIPVEPCDKPPPIV